MPIKKGWLSVRKFKKGRCEGQNWGNPADEDAGREKGNKCVMM